MTTTVAAQVMTAEEFWDWVHRPENEARHWELQNGKVMEMPSPGELHGVICSWIAALLWGYIGRRGRGGYVCSNDTGLIVKRGPDTVRGPDLMLFDEARKLDEMSRKYAENLPRLVVEVLSPNDHPSRVNLRISQYLERGVPMVWLVDPEDRYATIYWPDRGLRTFDETDDLDGGDALVGFHCRVAELFSPPGQPQ